tara:strand:- start:584 stop:1129 length:546 start_codon:yes stop_codon:yes gene_type:complete
MGIYPLKEAVFFDRDGVINQALVRRGHPYSPANLEQFTWVKGIHDVCEQLKSVGFVLICVTNQPDVGRGLQSHAAVENLHTKIMDALPLESIYSCYHDGIEDCACRKPKPGMLLEAANEYGVDLTRSWLIGDRWKDVDAGNAAGCKTVFVDYGYDEKLNTAPNHRVSDVREIPPVILQARQ